MKKILLVVPLSTLNWGSSSAGGVDSVCQMLVEHLTKRKTSNYNYRILAVNPLDVDSSKEELIKLSENVEVVFSALKRKKLGVNIPSIISVNLTVAKHVKDYKPDVVHTHLLAWIFGALPAPKRLVTLHSYKNICRSPNSFFNDFFHITLLPLIADRFTHRYTVVGMQLFDVVTACTSKEVEIVGNPIDISFFEKSLIDKNPGTLKLVTCAVLTERKRIEIAILVLNALRKNNIPASLSIIGPSGDHTYFSKLTQLVNDLGLSDSVKFLGALNRDDIITAYNNSDVGVFLSKEETFGLAPLEMIACQLPVLVSAVGVMGENKSSFENFKSIVFVDENAIEDYESMADAVLSLYRTKAGDAGKHIYEQFSASSIVSMYESVYEDM